MQTCPNKIPQHSIRATRFSERPFRRSERVHQDHRFDSALEVASLQDFPTEKRKCFIAEQAYC